MNRTPPTIRNRIISFVGIVGGAMILLALAALFGLPQSGDDKAAGLAETAAALDVRATEISAAATHLAQSPVGNAGQALQQSPADNRTFASAFGSRDAPVPAGETFHTLDGFGIRVLSANLDAWPLVQAENQFNDPPAENERMVLVLVEVQNLGGDDHTPMTIAESDFRLVGRLGVVYTTFDSESRCGVIPDELDATFFRGAVVTGNVCVRTPKADGDYLLIYWPDQTSAVYFALP